MLHPKLLVVFCLAGCASHGSPVATRPAAFDVSVNYFGDSTAGIGCLPSIGADSTQFILAVILNSAKPAADSFAISFAEPYVPPPPARNPNVSMRVYLPGANRVTGAGCSKSGGAVLRVASAALHQAVLTVDAPDAVLIEIYTSTGRQILSKRVMRPPTQQVIVWPPAPAT